MKMRLREARECLENRNCEECKYRIYDRDICEREVKRIATSAIMYLEVGDKLFNELETKER